MFFPSSLIEYLLPVSVKCKLKPEDSLCLEIANYLRAKTLEGECPFVWFHVANEGYFSASNKIRFWGMIKKAIGKFPGIADYIFLGNGKCFALEIKTKKTRQSENQKKFQDWCVLNKVPYECVNSFEDALIFFKENGIIT